MNINVRKYFAKEKILQYILVLLFVLTPLISAILFCLIDGKMITDIYIPLGGWSDEITYYKQIEGILSHGMPRGYFGYNQSRALYGSLGVWGLIPLIPYVIWGWLFGWDYCSPIFANIFFCVLALWVLYKFLHLSGKEMGMLSLFWITNKFLNRYVLSGVVEASVIMQLIIVTACGEYLLSEKNSGGRGRGFSSEKDGFVLAFCTFVICLLTLARPYFAVLFLIPLWKSIQTKRKLWIAGLPFLAIGIIALFFVNNHYFCSVYFSNIFSFERIRSDGISGLVSQLLHSLAEISRMIWYAIRYHDNVGWYYLLLFIELACMAGICIWRLIHRAQPIRMFVVSLVGNFLILLSIIEMYDLGVGARHILALIVVNAILLIIEIHFSFGAVLAVICILSIVLTHGKDALPYKDETYAEYMDTLKTTFSEVVTVTDEISYDNVVAMPTADQSPQNPEQKVCTYYGLLFAMPAGVGISLDFQDFYDAPENLKARYILVHPEGSIRATLENIGMTCIFENEEMALYSRDFSLTQR